MLLSIATALYPHVLCLFPICRQSVVSQTINAFDFAAPRSRKDARLLYDAKQGKVGDDGRLTPEQYQ